MHHYSAGWLSAVAMVLAASVPLAVALKNGQGLTPVLGWASWNYFENDISESTIAAVADGMVSTGLAAAGFKFVNLDAGVWLPNRSATGQLQPDPSKFPAGLPALAARLRQSGLTMGLYTDLSSRAVGKVCGTGPGSFGHFDDDAKAIVGYGAGFVKVDYCAYDWSGAHVPDLNASLGYWGEFRDAFNRTAVTTGRWPYLYFCPRSVPPKSVPTAPNTPIIDGPPLSWSAETRRGLANSLLTEYHNSGDTWLSAMSNLDALLGLADPAWNEPGYWQDADMLNTCNFGMGKRGKAGMTMPEYQAQYAVWSVMASNIIISAVPKVVQQKHPECLDLLKNAELIAFNQDPAGHAPRLLFQNPPNGLKPTTPTITDQGFARALHDGSVGCVLLNRECERGPNKTCVLGATWGELGLPADSSCNVRDVLNHVDLGIHHGGFNATVRAHAAVAIRVTC